MTSWTSARKRWLKSIGTAEDPLALDWVESDPKELSIVLFPKKPGGISVGDLLVYYAAVHQRLVGIVSVFMPPEFDAQAKRWPYSCQVRPSLIIKDMDRAPSIDVLNVEGERDFRKTVMRLSHAQLTDAEYERALQALEAAFDEDAGDIRSAGFNVAR